MIGGYGLFGVVVAATLRLVPRVQVERIVTMLEVEALIDTLERRIADGYTYGDFQFATDPSQPRLSANGRAVLLSPDGSHPPIPARQRRLSQSDWNRLLELAHLDKRRAFEEFAAFYRATSGQLYWSDTHQLNLYLESYHEALDKRLGRGVRGSEMITEIYIPRRELVPFMEQVRQDFRANQVDFIYGTIRLIEKDTESALPWARERYACVIFNLHIDHLPRSIVNARATFTRLIDHAMAFGGSLLPDLSPLRAPRSAARLPSGHHAVPRRQATLRPYRRLSERLVSSHRRAGSRGWIEPAGLIARCTRCIHRRQRYAMADLPPVSKITR